MRKQLKELSDLEQIETLDALYTAVSTLQGRGSTKQFLKSLLTESERIMLGRRILIARELIAGTTYDEIAIKYGAGKDTIQKIARWLEGQMPGYQKVISDMEKEFEIRKAKRVNKELYATSALYRLKKKFPLHFLLFPTPKSKK